MKESNKRKIRQPSDGEEKPPMTRLKELPAEERAKLMHVLRENTYRKAIPLIENLVGFYCSLDVLSKFFTWQDKQEDLEKSNDFIEQYEEFTQRQHPEWSPERIRDDATAFFMASATANKDLKGFALIAQIDQQERAGRAKVKFEERKISISDRRVTLLERKAAQADQAKGIMQDQQLSEDQRAARMRELFGIS